MIGMQAPSNYGADYKAAFDSIYPELAETYDVALHPNFLGALTSREDRSATVAEFMQGDGIHPNAAGVALIVQDIGPAVLNLIGKDAK